ncbi:hypothetical protein [Halomonas maura]|uniref:hypothetical protein n=1 Tax=Halomonas maura TaxID=117606 RepID=UPI0025B61D32|nr:hypothetical protein [Halomonas maura]MDN3554982.1 hypothetical protein [Halomonas maura]
MEEAKAHRDDLHQASATISPCCVHVQHALVVLEALRVGNKSRSARSNIEAPGHHIRATPGLNRSILDQGGYASRCRLDYQLA